MSRWTECPPRGASGSNCGAERDALILAPASGSACRGLGNTPPGRGGTRADAGRARLVTENPSGVAMLEAAARQGQSSCDSQTHRGIWRHGSLPAGDRGGGPLVRGAWTALVLSLHK